jgi:hypothetical protein
MLTKLSQFDEKVNEYLLENDEAKQILLQSKSEIEQLRDK